MARAKDVGVGQVFQQKSRAHEDKLRRFEADQLSCDMDRLFTEEMHSDMTVELRYKTLHLHSCIIKARSTDLYNVLFSISGSCAETKTVAMKTYAYTRTIEDLFRSLYTENDVRKCLHEFSQILASGSNTSISTYSSGEVLAPSDTWCNKDNPEQGREVLETTNMANCTDKIGEELQGRDVIDSTIIGNCKDNIGEELLGRNVVDTTNMANCKNNIGEELHGEVLDTFNSANGCDNIVKEMNGKVLDADCSGSVSNCNNDVKEPQDNLTNNSRNSLLNNAKSGRVPKMSRDDLVLDLGSMTDEERLRDMAGDIVNAALRNAFVVFGGEGNMPNVNVEGLGQGAENVGNILANGVTVETDINYNADVEKNEAGSDQQTNGQGKVGNSENNGNSETTGNGENLGNSEKSINSENSTFKANVTDVVNGDENSLKTESEQELIDIKSTKDVSQCSVTALLEKVYAMKTVMTPSGGLGEDLLRLWLTKTDCDAQILTDGSVFQVHKCILSCRSMYFGAMLGGSWRESDQDQIVLEGIDKGTMRQTLLYLYGGVVEVDPSCSLGGLVQMSDMYTMEGLKEVVAFNLNKEYCHYFHKPCPTCIVGTPEALTLTMIYNMDTMREKCVKWINKNFGKVWPTKQFALLPQEVLEFCVSSAVKDLNITNVIDMMVECQRLNEKIPRLKWSETVLCMTASLMDASIEFASQNFVNIVGSKTFRNIDNQGIAFNRQPLEEIFGMVIMALTPENSCQAYMSLQKWVALFKGREEDEGFPLYSKEFTEFVQFLFKKCKEHLCLYIHQAAHTIEWTYLSKDSQKEIMQEANYVCIDSPNKGRMARPQLTSMQKKVPTSSRLSLKEYIDHHFGLKGVEKKSKLPSPAKQLPERPGKTSGIPSRQIASKTIGQIPGIKKKETSEGTRGVVKPTGAGASPNGRTLNRPTSSLKPKDKVLRPPSAGARPKDVVVKQAVLDVKSKDKSGKTAVAEVEKKVMSVVKDKPEKSPISDVKPPAVKAHAVKKIPVNSGLDKIKSRNLTGAVSDQTLNKSVLNSVFKTKSRALTSQVNEAGLPKPKLNALDKTKVQNRKSDMNESRAETPDAIVSADTDKQATADGIDKSNVSRPRAASFGYNSNIPRFARRSLPSPKNASDFNINRNGVSVTEKGFKRNLEVDFIVPESLSHNDE